MAALRASTIVRTRRSTARAGTGGDPLGGLAHPVPAGAGEELVDRAVGFAAHQAESASRWGIHTGARVARWGARKLLGSMGTAGRLARATLSDRWRDEHGSYWSTDSRLSFASVKSHQSALSVWSLFSFGSAGSIGSLGSVASLGSAGSLLSVGSAGSILSIGSVGSILSIGGMNHRPAFLDTADDPVRRAQLVEAGAVVLGVAALTGAVLDR